MLMSFNLPSVGKPAITLHHFPSRLFAFIFRGSEFFSFEKLATLLKTDAENVESAASAMGITHAGNDKLWLEKGYITVIRAMWHLLPYEQLIELLETNADDFAALLREEDFLDIKLGDKPACECVLWHDPSASELERAAEIARDMRNLDEGGVLPFEFKYSVPDITFDGRRYFDTRMIYLHSGLYLTAFDVDSRKYCSDELLESYRKLGINAVWTQAVLYQLADFPFDDSLSVGRQNRIAHMRDFTERCEKYGIKLYLYINEPRSMPDEFYVKYPHLAGHKSDDGVCLCTSTRQVQDYISDSIESICEQVPLIGGFFTITRSENLTNCYSYSTPESCNCRRCKKLGIGRVIGDVIGCIRKGADRVNKDIKVMAWSWGWDRYNEDIIRRLPERVELLSQSELYAPYSFGGVNGRVVDYSMSVIGPGKRALSEWDAAAARGLETAAKVQVNTTWECSTVPALPVFPLVREHIKRLRECGVKHLMLSWTLGGYPSHNLAVAAEYYAQNVKYQRLSDSIERASKVFSDAFKQFPFDIGTLYKGPQNAGPSNLLYAEPTGYKATMTCFAYDDIDSWRSVYPYEVFEAQLQKLCDTWKSGLDILKNENECETVIMAHAAYCVFKSSLDSFKFYLARNAGDTASMRRLACSELATARRMLELMNKDASIGFEAANHYYFSKRAICEKVINCRYIIEKLLISDNTCGIMQKD